MSNNSFMQQWSLKDKDLERQLTYNLNNISMILSFKENSSYSSLESETAIIVYPEIDGGKKVLRKYIDFDTLRNTAGTDSIAHGLVYDKVFRIYGTANNSATKSALTIPYPSSIANDIITLNSDATNVNIIVGKDMSAYSARICIEYFL